MKVGGRFDLTYCSNIHPGETWQQVSANLAEALPRVRELLNAGGPFAIGLRLSAQAAETLASGDALDRFRDFLRAGDYYVPTINGFPYGAFHGERVKERVYLPDWRDEARVQYTNRLASILSELLADRPDIEGSVSTAPGAFRAHVRSTDDVRAIAGGILRHAEHLRRIHETTGRVITLAIEPEPACYIETVDDALAFFRDYLPDPDLQVSDLVGAADRRGAARGAGACPRPVCRRHLLASGRRARGERIHALHRFACSASGKSV